MITHISDIHRSRILLQKLQDLTVQSDVVIVSGDVTTFGEPTFFQEFMERLAKLKVKCFYVPGNNDRPDFVVPAEVQNLDAARAFYSGFSIGGLGGSPPTPFNTPYELKEEELMERLDKLNHVDILVSHSPPLNTPADRLDSGGHAGSKAVREYVLKMKPRLVLCGHVHEAVSKFKFGDSIVINPGSASSRRYAKVNFTDEIVATLSVF